MLDFNDIQTAVVVVMALCGFISAIGVAVKYITDWLRPAMSLSKTVNQHAECLDRDNKRLAELEAANRIQLRALMTIIGHELDPSNHTQQLKEAEMEIKEYLITK